MQWGALSDPFQPCELTVRSSLACLRIFAETQYPVLIGTKGVGVLTRAEYLDLVSASNVVVRLSMLAPQYDSLEPGAPPYAERLAALPKIARSCKRLIVRFQPYSPVVASDCLASLPALRDAGVYGITFEGLKVKAKRPGMVRIAGDWAYPRGLLERHFLRLLEAAHAVGLAMFAGENRLRELGDSLVCCGCEGLAGFVGNS
ncbi:MAG: radical SAM protein, partial [Actinobacteria bacterium]|nr:radical SAM protein [Actinomycetota bacterium]